jgi:hypothetical protein
MAQRWVIAAILVEHEAASNSPPIRVHKRRPVMKFFTPGLFLLALGDRHSLHTHFTRSFNSNCAMSAKLTSKPLSQPVRVSTRSRGLLKFSNVEHV